MSAEQYFDGQDTIVDIDRFLPLGWKARPLEDDLEGIEFYFPVPNDITPITFDEARTHVEDKEDEHDTIYAAGIDDSSEEAGSRDQMYFSVETVFPLSDGLFDLLEETKEMLTDKAQAALTPEEAVFKEWLAFTIATETTRANANKDVYFDAPDTFDDLPRTLPKGWFAELMDQNKVRFGFLVPQNFSPHEMAPIVRYVYEMQKVNGSRYEPAYEQRHHETGATQAAFMVETSWPIRNKTFTMLQVAAELLVDGSLDSLKVTDRALLDPKSWLQADPPA